MFICHAYLFFGEVFTESLAFVDNHVRTQKGLDLTLRIMGATGGDRFIEV